MSLKSSNDRRELYYRREEFILDFKYVVDNEEDPYLKKYFDLMSKSIGTHEEAFSSIIRGKSNPYALCFSRKKDNLTHWDRYADRCMGVAIGFDLGRLNDLDEKYKLMGFGRLFDTGQALYGQDDIRNFIRYRMTGALDIFLRGNTMAGGRNFERTIEEVGHILVGLTYNNAVKFAKMAQFSEEDEYRLYYDPSVIEDSSRLINRMKGEVDENLHNNIRKHFKQLVIDLDIRDEKFTMTPRGIRGFHDLCLKKIWSSDIIPEIVLGPMCVQNKYELKRFLKCNGLKGTKVTESSVPIR
ncbi:MAG: hypothetical protein IJV90_02410 [Candidatus Methanomethylophilaceae archaeon]|nr:hypothetical protein [Candidatus Methanomethylophilaceae archaeon]